MVLCSISKSFNNFLIMRIFFSQPFRMVSLNIFPENISPETLSNSVGVESIGRFDYIPAMTSNFFNCGKHFLDRGIIVLDIEIFIFFTSNNFLIYHIQLSSSLTSFISSSSIRVHPSRTRSSLKTNQIIIEHRIRNSQRLFSMLKTFIQDSSISDT